MPSRDFIVEARQSFGNNPLRETQEPGLSVEYAVEPLWDTVFLCLYAAGEGEAVVFRREAEAPERVRRPLWEGSHKVGVGLLDHSLAVLTQNGFATMEHYYLASEILDATCLHVMARLERGGPLRHVYIETPNERESVHAARIYRALEALVWYSEEEIIRRSAETPGWLERIRRWFPRFSPSNRRGGGP